MRLATVRKHNPSIGTRLVAAAGAALWVLSMGAVAPPASANSDTHCLDVLNVTAFAPRDEVYVTVRSKCREPHFAKGDPVLARIDAVVGTLPPRHEEISVYRGEADLERTIVFENLVLEPGQALLIRLLENGDVVEVVPANAR